MVDPFATLCTPAELSAVETRCFCRVPVGRLRRTALRLTILCWDEWASEGLLRRRVRAKFRRAVKEEGYGSTVLLFVLSAIAAEIIGWAVSKLLDWWWDRHSDAETANLNRRVRTAQIYQWQKQLRAA